MSNSVWAKAYIKSCESMREVEDNSIQMAITSLPDIHMIPQGTFASGFSDITRYLLLSRQFGIKQFYPWLGAMSREIDRVLKDDGVFFLNIGSPVRFWSLSGYSVLLPFFFAEHIVYDSNLSLRRDFILNQQNVNPDNTFVILPEEHEHGIACTHEHLFMFSKHSKWKMIMPQGGSVLPTSWHYTKEEDPVARALREKGIQVSTPFPREVIEFIMKLFTEEGDTVLDPCGGIGTLATIASKNRRNSIFYEINPDMIPVIKEQVPNVEVYQDQIQVQIQEKSVELQKTVA